MIRRTLTLPEIGLIAGTRAALGAGIALLVADRLSRDQRRAVGWTLVAVGGLSTIPLVAHVMFGRSDDGDSLPQRPRQRQTNPVVGESSYAR